MHNISLVHKHQYLFQAQNKTNTCTKDALPWHGIMLRWRLSTTDLQTISKNKSSNKDLIIHQNKFQRVQETIWGPLSRIYKFFYFRIVVLDNDILFENLWSFLILSVGGVHWHLWGGTYIFLISLLFFRDYTYIFENMILSDKNTTPRYGVFTISLGAKAIVISNFEPSIIMPYINNQKVSLFIFY